MALTPAVIDAMIDANLADDSNIPASKHREVERELLNLIKTKPSLAILNLDVFTTDRNYTLPTGLTSPAQIVGVTVMLQCKVANNGYAVGDTVTGPTPYPADNGRTPAQGIGVQYNNSTINNIRILVNDELSIMNSYVSTPNAQAGVKRISGNATANWRIKLYVHYIYP